MAIPTRVVGRGPLAAAALLLLLWASCGQDPAEVAPPAGADPAPAAGLGFGFETANQLDPPTARWAQADELRADLDAPRHPSDGGGRAWLIDGSGEPLERGQAEARIPGSWTLRFEAGELGVAVGGAVFFMPELFWGWSAPQTKDPRRLGFTRVSCAAAGVQLELQDLGPMIRILIGGRALAPGERIEVAYGADGAGALPDVQAERGARLWISVDGDGDGVRRVLEDSPRIDVRPGPPGMLELLVRGAHRVGEEAELVASVLDAYGNLCSEAAGTIQLERRPADWELPAQLEVQGGRASLRFPCKAAGVLRLRARYEHGDRILEDEANPLWIGPQAPRVLWADLHGHSHLSDGTGTPEDWYRYARDVALLDVAALTDHDHFGVQFLDQRPELWSRIQAVTAEHHDPGRFVTVLGYEWTSWIHGHRHVLHFGDEAPLHSSLNEGTDDPAKLWAALRGTPSLTLAHHTAGEPVATNWSFRPDPELEPLVEVLSVHGSSEARDAPRTVRGAREGYFVRDQLKRGIPLGMIGSGDSHDGHPGLPHLSPMYGARPATGGSPRELGTGGLAGIWCEELSRKAVLSSLRARQTYATSGPRCLLSVSLGGALPGARVPLAPGEVPAALELVAVADGWFTRVDLVTSWDGVRRQELGGERTFQAALDLEGAQPGDWCYLRFLQSDRGQILSSPYFFEAADEADD